MLCYFRFAIKCSHPPILAEVPSHALLATNSPLLPSVPQCDARPQPLLHPFTYPVSFPRGPILLITATTSVCCPPPQRHGLEPVTHYLIRTCVSALHPHGHQLSKHVLMSLYRAEAQYTPDAQTSDLNGNECGLSLACWAITRVLSLSPPLRSKVDSFYFIRFVYPKGLHKYIIFCRVSRANVTCASERGCGIFPINGSECAALRTQVPRQVCRNTHQKSQSGKT